MFLRKTGALYPWLIMANIYQQFWAAQRMNFAWETAESRGSLVSAILRGWWHSGGWGARTPPATKKVSLKDPEAPPLKFPKKHKMFHFHLIEEKK